MKPFTRRQKAIIEMINDKKQSCDEFITLDEIEAGLKEQGFKITRNSLVVSMNLLCERLRSSGVYIRKNPAQIGRGKRTEYLLMRYQK
jgi:hypothetical protein